MYSTSWRTSIRRYKYLYMLLLPALIYYIIFHYFPIYGITLAFKDLRISKGIIGSPWTDPLLRHFTSIFSKSDFWRAVRNTFVISFYKILFAFPAPIILALLMNEVRVLKFKKITQTVMYLPHFISWVVIGGIIITVLSVNGGVVNGLLGVFGIEPKQYITDYNYFRFILVVSHIWKTTGWTSIIYLASLSMIDIYLYEAAIIDGANRWKQLWNITIPGIRSTIAVILVLNFGNIMNIGFEQVFILYSVPVYVVGDIISTYVYRKGIIGMQYSMATAAGLSQSVVSFIFVVSANTIVKKLGEEGIY